MKQIISPENFANELALYNGANAQIWLFGITFKRMAIRLSFEDCDNVLYIVLLGCEHIKAPFSWKMASLSIMEKENSHEDNDILVDVVAGVEIVFSGGYSMLKGAFNIIDNSFDSFLANG